MRYKVNDSDGNPVQAGDKVRVESTDSKDGIPEYRQGDIAKVNEVKPSGEVKIEYLNEPLKEYKCDSGAIAKHTKKA